MRETNKLLRWIIPGSVFFLIWFLWLILHAVVGNVTKTVVWPNLDAPGVLLPREGIGDGLLAAGAAGLTLITGHIIAQFYWALYWLVPGAFRSATRALWLDRVSPVMNHQSLVDFALVEMPWQPSGIRCRLSQWLRWIFPVIDYQRTLELVLAKVPSGVPDPITSEVREAFNEARRNRSDAWAAFTSLWYRFAGRNPSWQGEEYRAQLLYDAYHSLGTSMTAIIMALITLGLIASAQLLLEMTNVNWIAVVFDLAVSFILYIAFCSGRHIVVRNTEIMIRRALLMFFREANREWSNRYSAPS